LIDHNCRGGDIHVGVDGNMSHRHIRNAGDSPSFYTPRHFLPQEFVDAVGRHVEVARKQVPKAFTPLVPDEDVDVCRDSYKAAKGDDDHTESKMFDDQGIMAMVCHHNTPIFLANIDMPGEQQKYVIALILWLYHFLPADANVVL
jgi:hypothetical protein